LLVALGALCIMSVAAQPQSTPPQQSKGRVAFTVREAPENLVYEIFFGELEFLRHLADDRKSKGKDDTGVRTYIREKFGLTDFEQQTLTSASRACVATGDMS
jgi:hypothetical protein